MTQSCGHCGKFISNESIEKEKSIQGINQGCNGQPTSYYFICRKCIKKDNSE